MKKFIATACILTCTLLKTALPVGSTTETFVGPPESTKRLITGNYSTCGLIFTDDGEVWEYYDPTESIPEDYRVVVCFDMNETETIQDDEVLKMVPLEIQDGTMYWEHF